VSPTPDNHGGPGTKGQPAKGARLTTEPGDPFPGSLSRHGTETGFTRHQKLGEDPCELCRIAKHQADARRKEVPEKVLRGRLAAKAQARAQVALARKYREEYHALYDSELDRILAEHDLTRLQRRRKPRPR
jgi:ribosomal protein L15